MKNCRKKSNNILIGLSIVSTFSFSAAMAQSDDTNPLLRPLSLLDDSTDKKIRTITIPEVPKKRTAKKFDPSNKLSLDDTLCIVDTHYPKLLQGHIEVEKASARRLESQGAFDPFYKHISEFKRIQDIVITGKAKDAVHNEGQLTLPTRSGIKFFGRLRVNPNDASTPFLQSGRSGEYTAGAIIPLLRGLGVNKDRAREQKARLGEPLSRVNLNISRMNVLFDASKTYWSWYVANQKLKVMQGLLKIGENRVDLVVNKVKAGDLPSLAIKEAEKEVRRRKGAVIKSEREVAKAAFKLSLFLWSENEQSPPVINQIHLPKEKLTVRRLSTLETENGIKKALQVRPEFTAISIEKNMVEVDLKLAKNLFLPQVNLLYRQGADTGVNGIGMVFGGGIEMAVPLRQRKARGLIKQAKQNFRKLELEEQFLKRSIRIEIMDRASELNAAYERYTQAGKELDRARAVESGERQRFDLGDSSLFLVNRRERDRAEVEKKRIEIYGEYLKALAAFKTVTGDI